MSRVRVVKLKLNVSVFLGREIVGYKDVIMKEISTACEIFDLLIRRSGRVILSYPSPLLRDREIIRTRLFIVKFIRPLKFFSYIFKS